MEAGAIIGLSIKDHNPYIHIKIYDNGAGMNQEIKKALLTSSSPVLSQKNTTGLGTTNMFKRWRLYYSEEDIVDIETEEGKGTAFILKLPVNRSNQGEGTLHVSSVNCRRRANRARRSRVNDSKNDA
jgi:sensor histidine kinase YesM